MNQVDILGAIEAADAAVENAQRVRKHHRRRTDRRSRQRAQDINAALGMLRDAMTPLRSYLGGFPYRPQTDTTFVVYDAVIEASQAIQRERRKLWKMKNRSEEVA